MEKLRHKDGTGEKRGWIDDRKEAMDGNGEWKA